MHLTIEIEQEEDRRWILEAPDLPKVIAYGQTREEAMARGKVLGLRALADRFEHGGVIPETDDFSVGTPCTHIGARCGVYRVFGVARAKGQGSC
ncbi:type II toxin-antitoxin system HicB family antitoxin [Desulfosoma sp.]